MRNIHIPLSPRTKYSRGVLGCHFLEQWRRGRSQQRHQPCYFLCNCSFHLFGFNTPFLLDHFNTFSVSFNSSRKCTTESSIIIYSYCVNSNRNSSTESDVVIVRFYRFTCILIFSKVRAGRGMSAQKINCFKQLSLSSALPLSCSAV